MNNELPISHFLMAQTPEDGIQFVVTESHDGYWAMSDAMIARTVRFSAEHRRLGGPGFQCVANGDPGRIGGHGPYLVRLDFCREPTMRLTTVSRFQSLAGDWRFRFLCIEAPEPTPEILSVARDYDAVFMAPTQDELYGVVRLLMGPGNAIGFDLADVLALVVGRAVEVKHLAIADLPAYLEAAETGVGMIVGFSHRLTLTDVDGIVSSLPERPDGATIIHDTVCGVATLSAEVFVCRSTGTP